MKDFAHSFVGLAVIVVGAFAAVAHLGLVDFRWPWQVDALASVESALLQPERATIVEVEPIALDCRARIHTVVPVEARREHKLLGKVYRTDTVTMNAVGDIDTCVDSGGVEVIVGSGGTTRVLVPAEAIRFVRPRVDAVATYDSVEFDKGFVGKLTDVFPWVSENSSLTPAAYAYAQAVIGSSQCMEQAYEATVAAVSDAYVAQLVAKGVDADDVSVDLVGIPDFTSASGDMETVDGFDLGVDVEHTRCEVATTLATT